VVGVLWLFCVVCYVVCFLGGGWCCVVLLLLCIGGVVWCVVLWLFFVVVVFWFVVGWVFCLFGFVLLGVFVWGVLLFCFV
jgi:hypothetical protein